MVQIIKGTFGYYDGKRIRPITKEDGAVSFSPELEKRLVEVEKIAEYVVAPEEVKQENFESEDSSENMLLKQLDEMKLDELKQLAKDLELDTKAAKTKADFVKLIEAAQDEIMYVDGDGETPPEFDAEEAVD